MCLQRSVNRRCGWASTAWALGGKTPARAEVSGAAVASATSCPLHPPSVPTLREQALAETTCPHPAPSPAGADFRAITDVRPEFESRSRRRRALCFRFPS